MKASMRAALGVAALALSCTTAIAQKETADAIARYRQLLQDGNPAELVVARGEALWKEKRGPKNASLEQCDLGLGAGVVKGAYAQMPRYFADADQVMDFESRVVHCMVTLQGFDYASGNEEPLLRHGSAANRNRSACCLRCRAVARSAGQHLAGASEGKGVVRPRQAVLLHARRSVRLFMRHMPRRDGSAHSAAGSTEHRAATRRTRSARLPPGPRIACRRARCARCSGA